jgi:hypothetical protein
MKRTLTIAALSAALALGFVGAPTALADQTQFTDFEGFKVGASIENQNGWSADDINLDQEIVDFGGNSALRVSNAYTSGSFGDKIFAPRLGGTTMTATNPTNDSPGAFAGESTTGTSLKVFKAKFSFRSATGIPQPGLDISVSADNGQGGRQSYIGIFDSGGGLELYTFDIDSGGNFVGPIVLASGLSYKKWHTASVEIQFKDGPSNDVVKYFVN